MSMAGEYLVAAQLQRYEIASSVTYGNAKSADVIAFYPDLERVAIIEVKTSSRGQWIIGNRVPEPSDRLWVFVHLPENPVEPPEFFILTQAEIHKELKPGEEAYMKRYKEKHGEEYGNRRGVTTMKKKQALKYKDRWETIINALTINNTQKRKE